MLIHSLYHIDDQYLHKVALFFKRKHLKEGTLVCIHIFLEFGAFSNYQIWRNLVYVKIRSSFRKDYWYLIWNILINLAFFTSDFF